MLIEYLYQISEFEFVHVLLCVVVFNFFHDITCTVIYVFVVFNFNIHITTCCNNYDKYHLAVIPGTYTSWIGTHSGRSIV